MFSGAPGLSDKQAVKAANQETRKQFQLESSSYHKVLLRLHALSGINSKMMENLFCKHVTSKGTMLEHLQHLLQEGDAKDDK